MISSEWVRDTRFGTWFLTTDVWLKYVVQEALADLMRLLGDHPRSYPTILDIGCGAGRAWRLLDETFSPSLLVGVDPDPTMLTRAAKEIGRCRCRVDLRKGCAASLDLPAASVDLIFCHQTFHHLPDPEQAACEFHRVLRPGGVLLFAESCAPFIRSLPVRLLFRHPMYAQRTANEYLRLLRSTGFEFTDGQVSAPYPWWSRPDLGLLERVGISRSGGDRDTVLNVVAVRGS
ncbi:MAG: class I SAM-dependent methyltransferase [Vicinamibacterales bacterium]